MKPLLIAGVVLLSGCAQLMPAAKPQTLYYQCGTMPLTVTLNPGPQGDSVTFLLDGESHLCPRCRPRPARVTVMTDMPSGAREIRRLSCEAIESSSMTVC